MRKIFLLSGLFAALLLASCKKSNNNSYSGQPTVNYQLKATNTSYAVAKTTAAANIVWTSGFAYPDVVKFEAKQGNVEVEFKSTNNGQIDLMASVAVTFGNFTIPPGTYDEIEVKIDLDKMGATPIMQLTGQFTAATVTLPILLQVTRSVELKTEQHNVTIANNDSYTAVTTLDLSAITAGITAVMLLNAQLTGGTIVISENSNTLLYNVILDNLEHEHHHCEFEWHHE